RHRAPSYALAIGAGNVVSSAKAASGGPELPTVPELCLDGVRSTARALSCPSSSSIHATVAGAALESFRTVSSFVSRSLPGIGHGARSILTLDCAPSDVRLTRSDVPDYGAHRSAMPRGPP